MKRIIYVCLIILLIIICAICFLLYNTFSNKIINISNINDFEKKEIIKIIGLNDLYDEITLEKLEVPKIYKDIYYKIYFWVLKDDVINELNTNTNLYIDYNKISDSKYSCIISNQGKSIEILEQIINKYKK